VISFELLYAILDNDCRSKFSVQQQTTTIVMCPAPKINEPVMPAWWRAGMSDKAEPQAMPKVKKAVKKTKKKRSKKRRR
jgi:hypothetical protein